MTARLPATYVLPLKASAPVDDLSDYLAELVELVEVVVVDASSPDVVAAHAAAWPAEVVHVGVDPDVRCRNGKVAGVLTGLRHASSEVVVIADDDMRHTPSTLRRLVDHLDTAHVAVPANYFDPLPWHARWDTGRTLLNRALGHDHPGTLAVRRTALEATGGYDGDVLFENFELVETIRAAGGVVAYAPDVLVRRLPPDLAHFLDQRVRQAYDSLAQPVRLAAELAIVPSAVALVRRGGLRAFATAVGGAVVAAEIGRRRDRGRTVFPATSALWAPAWVAERGVCAWLAIGARLRGGARYAGGRVRRPATPRRVLRARHASVGLRQPYLPRLPGDTQAHETGSADGASTAAPA